MSHPDHIELVIGQYPDYFSAKDCRDSARAFRLARKRYPQAKIGISVGGYDNDPRELYDIPEAREYICRWARKAGLSDWRVAIEVPWGKEWDLALLQLCGVFADDSPITVITPS